MASQDIPELQCGKQSLSCVVPGLLAPLQSAGGAKGQRWRGGELEQLEGAQVEAVSYVGGTKDWDWERSSQE